MSHKSSMHGGGEDTFCFGIPPERWLCPGSRTALEIRLSDLHGSPQPTSNTHAPSSDPPSLRSRGTS
jgi:hypothetical protein